MTDSLLVVLDLLLALGAALRLSRFVVADDVPGQWWIKDPLYARAVTSLAASGWNEDRSEKPRHWSRYLEGLSCPYCVSVWMSAAVTLALFLAGGAGDAADWWRYGAGFLALAWATGHIAARAGDVEDD